MTDDSATTTTYVKAPQLSRALEEQIVTSLRPLLTTLNQQLDV